MTGRFWWRFPGWEGGSCDSCTNARSVAILVACQLGKPVPQMSHVPYVQYLVSRAARVVRAQGIGFFVKDLGRFAGNKIRKSGMEKVEGE